MDSVSRPGSSSLRIEIRPRPGCSSPIPRSGVKPHAGVVDASSVAKRRQGFAAVAEVRQDHAGPRAGGGVSNAFPSSRHQVGIGTSREIRKRWHTLRLIAARGWAARLANPGHGCDEKRGLSKARPPCSKPGCHAGRLCSINSISRGRCSGSYGMIFPQFGQAGLGVTRSGLECCMPCTMAGDPRARTTRRTRGWRGQCGPSNDHPPPIDGSGRVEVDAIDFSRRATSSRRLARSYKAKRMLEEPPLIVSTVAIQA